MSKEKVGVYVCHCGTNIAGTVDVEDVAIWAEDNPNVEVSRDYKFMCSSLGQELIEEDMQNTASHVLWLRPAHLICMRKPSEVPAHVQV